MASVLLCEDERLGRLVAVKRLHADSPAETEQRFIREAKLGALLNHPNLVSVFDTAVDDEGVLIVMEYVRGEPLSAELRRGPLAPERVGGMASELGAALDHAHSQGVTHRDVKPGNVLLREDGVTKLVDLGIATAADGTRITRSGTVLGTAAYMAPEQLEGREAGPAADIYSFAAVCFEALSGRKPRTGRTHVEIAHAIASKPPPDLAEAWPGAPARAGRVLRRGMARDPEDRQASAGEFATELVQALEARPERTALTRRLGRRRAGAVAAGGAAAAGAAAAAGGATAGASVADAGVDDTAPSPRPEPSAPRPSEPSPPRPREHGPPPASRPPGTRRSPGRRPSSLVLALGALIAVLAAVTAIAALSSGGGDGEPAASGSGDARSEQPKAGAKKKREAAKEKKQEEQASAEPAPATPATPAEPEPEPQPEPAPSPSYDAARGAQLNEDGFALMNAGDYDAAIPVLQQAVDSFPPGTGDINYAYALFNLGKSLRLAGRPEEAIPILEQRLEIPDQTATVQAELDAARRDAGG
jgi:serine/threonine-protein kinase